MATPAAKSETLPTAESVAQQEPQPVTEVPAKKIVLVKEKSTEEKSPVEENQQQTQCSEMEVDGDIIRSHNQT